MNKSLFYDIAVEDFQFYCKEIERINNKENDIYMKDICDSINNYIIYFKDIEMYSENKEEYLKIKEEEEVKF